jgi:integrase
MGDRRITKRLVDSLKPTGQDHFIWDDTLPGFGVRVQPTGAKSYVVKYRAGSGRGAPTRRLTLGKVGTITPDEARALARKTLGAVAHGGDPAAAKTAERRASTLRELAEFFLAEHVEAKRKATTATHYRSLLDRIVLPALGSRKAEQITPSDLAKLHAKMRDQPYQANRMLEVISSLYSFAGKRKILPLGFNPARAIEQYPEKPRERYLSTDELSCLGDAVREAETVGLFYEIDETKPTAKYAPKEVHRRTKIGPHAAAAVRLLILTGARLREILHLKWEHVDLERGLLLLTDSKTGKKAIVLNAPALDILANLPRVGAYVIAGQAAGTNDEKPRADLNRPWRAIVRRAGLTGLRIHDLRHTHASVAAGLGLGLPIIGKLLGHTQPSTTARYAHLDADPLRRASDHIGSRIAAAMGDLKPRSGGEVVPLRHAGPAQSSVGKTRRVRPVDILDANLQKHREQLKSHLKVFLHQEAQCRWQAAAGLDFSSKECRDKIEHAILSLLFGSLAKKLLACPPNIRPSDWNAFRAQFKPLTRGRSKYRAYAKFVSLIAEAYETQTKKDNGGPFSELLEAAFDDANAVWKAAGFSKLIDGPHDRNARLDYARKVMQAARKDMRASRADGNAQRRKFAGSNFA